MPVPFVTHLTIVGVATRPSCAYIKEYSRNTSKTYISEDGSTETVFTVLTDGIATHPCRHKLYALAVSFIIFKYHVRKIYFRRLLPHEKLDIFVTQEIKWRLDEDFARP